MKNLDSCSPHREHYTPKACFTVTGLHSTENLVSVCLVSQAKRPASINDTRRLAACYKQTESRALRRRLRRSTCTAGAECRLSFTCCSPAHGSGTVQSSAPFVPFLLQQRTRSSGSDPPPSRSFAVKIKQQIGFVSCSLL